MKSKKKEAKFFCESCGSEVPRNSKVCPTCGKFFASVRCPQCGRTGTNDDFKNGCPTCGYAVNPDSLNGNSRGYSPLSGNTKKSNIKYRNTNSIWNTKNRTHKKAKYNDSSLPVWVYAGTLLVLGILVIMLYSCL